MRFIKEIPMLLVVLFTWIVLIWFLTTINLLLLIPWDVAMYRPDIGTWQRTLNDFFSSQTGYVFTTSIIAFLTAIPLAKILRHHWYANTKIVVANILTVFIGYFLMIASFALNNFIFPVQTGSIPSNPFALHNYYRSIIPMISIWILYVIWICAIKSLSTHKQKNKAQNHSHYSQASYRLTDRDADASSPFQEVSSSKKEMKTQ